MKAYWSKRPISAAYSLSLSMYTEKEKTPNTLETHVLHTFDS